MDRVAHGHLRSCWDARRTSQAWTATTPRHGGLEPLITVDELALYLGLPKQTIYDWRVSGKGPRAYRLGSTCASR